MKPSALMRMRRPQRRKSSTLPVDTIGFVAPQWWVISAILSEKKMTLANVSLLFSGLRVLDVSQGIAGPYCAQVLCQQGVAVIKVEPPAGDWGRSIGVFRGQLSGLSAAYNAGKTSLALDASAAAGKELLRELALSADVLVQNYRPGVAHRLGIDAELLLSQKRPLAYVSISGYGSYGPYAKLAATDSVLQTGSGLMCSNRDANGRPRKEGLLLADVATGLYAVQATSAVLYRQEKTKSGAHFQISSLDASVALQAYNLSDFNLAPDTTIGAVSATNGTFMTRDRCLSVVGLNNAQFRNFFAALEQSHWMIYPRFSAAKNRLERALNINERVAGVLTRRERAHWVSRLREHDVRIEPLIADKVVVSRAGADR